MKLSSPLALALTALVLASCAQPRMTRTGPTQAPRPENCKYRLLTTVPAERYMELAVIDVDAAYAPKNMATFGKKIAPKVCEAGGDAVIARANGNGQWIKATVLKRLPDAPPPPQPPMPPHHAGQPPAAPAATAGCSFDTQCKGDRICVDGKCVSPPPAAAPPPATTESTPAE